MISAGPGRLHPETATLMPMCVKAGTSPCHCMLHSWGEYMWEWILAREVE